MLDGWPSSSFDDLIFSRISDCCVFLGKVYKEFMPHDEYCLLLCGSKMSLKDRIVYHLLHFGIRPLHVVHMFIGNLKGSGVPVPQPSKEMMSSTYEPEHAIEAQPPPSPDGQVVTLWKQPDELASYH